MKPIHIEGLSRNTDSLSQELIVPGADAFPQGLGLRIYSEEALDVVSLLRSQEALALLELAKFYKFLVFVNTKPVENTGPKVWGANEPTRFIPPHVDTISPFTVVQLADSAKPRPYPTTFTTVDGFNSVLKSSRSVYSGWQDLNEDYIFAYNSERLASSRECSSFQKGMARIRRKTREFLAQCSPLYEHDWTQWPHSSVLFHNEGQLLHGRIIPEEYNKIPPSQLGVVLNWFYRPELYLESLAAA